MARASRGYEAVIVGGGIIGLTCAWRLAQRGLSVCVLDRGRAHGAATPVAAGILAPLTGTDFGEEALLSLKLAAVEAYPAFVEELEEASGLPVDYRRPGCLYVALDRDEAEELGRLHDLRRSFGLETDRLPASGCRALEPGLTTACAGALHAPGDAAVDPRTLVPALERALDLAGGTVVREEVVAALFDHGRIAGVESTAGTRYSSGEIVLSSGSWSGTAPWLPEALRPPVRPVKGQLLILRGAPGEPVCSRLIWGERVYMTPRGDGGLVVGATAEERGFDTTVTAGAVLELLREAYRVLPDVAELELAEIAVGLRPGSPDNAPLIGRGAAEGLLLATGHYRNGILLAPVTADAIAALLTGDEPPAAVAPFSPDRFRAEVPAG